MSFNVDSYLFRLALKRAKPSLIYLRELQIAHQKQIPIENFDLFIGIHRQWEVEHLFTKIISGRRGGLGMELNAIFGALLMRLGFRAIYVSLHNLLASGRRIEHLGIIVNLEGNLWLVDVGRSTHLLNPLKIIENEVMLNYTHYVRFVSEEEDWQFQTSQDAVHFETQYDFQVKEQKLIEFLQVHNQLQSIYESPYASERSISKVHQTGRLTLTSSKLELRQGRTIVESEEIQNEQAFDQFLRERFGIEWRMLVQ